MTGMPHHLPADDPVAAAGPRPSPGTAGRRLAAVGMTAAAAPDPGRLLLVMYGVEPPAELLTEFAAGGFGTT